MATPKSGIKTMPTGTTKNEAIFNEGIILLESLVYRGVISRQVVDPSGISPTPANGDIYLVPPDGSPTLIGDFSGQGDKIAVYYDGWRFLNPDEGITLWIVNESQSVQYRGGVWVDMAENAPTLLDDLTDVLVSGSPSLADGDALVWSAADGKWVNGVGAGIAKIAQLTAASVTHTTATNIVVSWDTENYDTNAFHDAGNPTRISAPWTGWYDLRFTAFYDSVAGAFLWQSTLNVNRAGSTTFFNDRKQLRYDGNNASTTAPRSIRASGLVHLTAGDYVEWLLFQSGVNRTLNATYTTATIRYVGT